MQLLINYHIIAKITSLDLAYLHHFFCSFSYHLNPKWFVIDLNPILSVVFHCFWCSWQVEGNGDLVACIFWVEDLFE